AWQVAPLLALAVAWAALTFLPTTSQDDLVPERRAWTSMGTTLEATVYRPATARPLAQADLAAVYSAVIEIDQLMSLYLPDSELVALNAHAGAGTIEVSTPTLEVLRAAQHYARLSGGALDITVQPLVELWGFYRMERNWIPPEAKIQEALRQIGPDRINLDTAARTVVLAAGSQLDLGSIAKGYAIDRAIEVLRARGVPAALIDLGGNIGVLGQPPDGRSWVVGIRHPRRDQLIGLLRLRSGAVATSGDYDRYFEVAGRRFSHLLDPRTGWPAEGMYSVTVVAPNATAADALSTAAFVLGPERGMALLSECQGVEGLLIQPLNDQVPGQQDSAELAVSITTGPSQEGAVSFVLEPGTNATLRSPAPGATPSVIGDCVLPMNLVRP
ncbi:MAG: FAD:protein FMN transferase, partial [Acidobacteria bacterium]|nr:FAD:protein FMN transferase [Acidobacteriota bacterium]